MVSPVINRTCIIDVRAEWLIDEGAFDRVLGVVGNIVVCHVNNVLRVDSLRLQYLVEVGDIRLVSIVFVAG